MPNAAQIRTCIITGKKILKTDLWRIVNIDNEVKLDINQIVQARGIYISKSLELLTTAITKHTIERRLRLKRSLTIQEINNILNDVKKTLSSNG